MASLKKKAPKLIYKKILLKLSGEALMGDKSYGLDPSTVRFMAAEIKKVYDMGVEISVVIGGGNIVISKRGESSFLRREPVILTSQQIPLPHSGRWR
jgi:uridylate kinase